MTFRISQRAKQYLKTAQTSLRAAQTMTDGAIAGQLEALADDYERRPDRQLYRSSFFWREYGRSYSICPKV
jgi:hypothetical protein